MSDELEPRRKRLLFRCCHMGMRETDLLLGGFARAHMADLEPARMAELERLLDCADHDLLNWILEREPPPEAYRTALLGLIIKFNKRR